jgi:hypothetical protein
MKPSFVEYVLAYAASALMLAMVFHGSFGLPNYLGDFFLMASMVCFFFFWRALYRRAQAYPGTLPPYSDTLNRWIVPVIVIAFMGGLAAFILEILHQ